MIELISIQQIKKPAPLLVIKPRFADSFDGTIQMNTLRQNFHIVLITFFSLSNFWVCGPNSVVWPFKWKLFGNTITWYYLVFSSLRLYFFWILIFAYHAIEPKGWISDTKTLQSMERKLLDKDRWMKQKKKTKQDGKYSSHWIIFTRFRRNSPFWSLHMQCSSQSAPLRESRKRSTDGPHQKGSRAIVALSFFNSLGLKMSLLLQLQ